jgi:NADH-quinone oxidoreductase subunit L
MVALTFHGEARTDTARDPEPVRWNVKAPLAVLGVLAATVGFVNMTPVAKLTGAHIEYLHQWLDGPLTGTSVHHYDELLHETGYAVGTAGLGETNLALVGGAVSLALALAGALSAWRLYAVPEPEVHTDRLGGVKTVLYNNYYQDEYQVWLAEGLTRPVARAADTFDQGVVDGLVNLASSASLFAGRQVRKVQTGVVTDYATLLTLGLTALLLAFAVLGGWL